MLGCLVLLTPLGRRGRPGAPASEVGREWSAEPYEPVAHSAPATIRVSRPGPAPGAQVSRAGEGGHDPRIRQGRVKTQC